MERGIRFTSMSWGRPRDTGRACAAGPGDCKGSAGLGPEFGDELPRRDALEATCSWIDRPAGLCCSGNTPTTSAFSVCGGPAGCSKSDPFVCDVFSDADAETDWFKGGPEPAVVAVAGELAGAFLLGPRARFFVMCVS